MAQVNVLKDGSQVLCPFSLSSQRGFFERQTLFDKGIEP